MPFNMYYQIEMGIYPFFNLWLTVHNPVDKLWITQYQQSYPQQSTINSQSYPQIFRVFLDNIFIKTQDVM